MQQFLQLLWRPVELLAKAKGHGSSLGLQCARLARLCGQHGVLLLAGIAIVTATGFAVAAVFLALRLALRGEARRERGKREEEMGDEREIEDELQIRRKCS